MPPPPTARSVALRRLAQAVAAAIPVDLAPEIVLTGSVSRGVADELSDVEMLIVTADQLSLDRCYELAAGAGLRDLDSWGPRGGPAWRVSGYRDGVSFELIWWSRAETEGQLTAVLDGGAQAFADALTNGIALRTAGAQDVWRDRLAEYPHALAAARIEQAVEPWGGFAPAGVLTLLRSGDRLTVAEWLTDGAQRILTVVYALNRVWQPTTKRLAARTATLPVQPDRLADRITAALTEPDSRAALRLITELELEVVRLAPAGPNVDRARRWLAPALELLNPTPAPTPAPTSTPSPPWG
jgi:hypothetical protein